jgi:hypothetical protein
MPVPTRTRTKRNCECFSEQNECNAQPGQECLFIGQSDEVLTQALRSIAATCCAGDLLSPRLTMSFIRSLMCTRPTSSILTTSPGGGRTGADPP